MATESERFGGTCISISPPIDGRKAYRFHILLTLDEEGSWSAIALNLPGVGSCGDSEEEAINNFREAALGALEEYHDLGQTIPWKESLRGEIPAGAKQKWILVHV